jgi:putative ABC transport system permease protein
MIRIAIAMLVGEKGRYLGMILGIAFSAFVITQQGSIFCGLMSRTFGFLTDTGQPDIWVVDPKVQYVDDIKPLQDTQLLRVKGIKGVEWAVPMYKGQLKARLYNGAFQTCNVIGLDDTTLLGGPPKMVQGALSDLRRADGVIVDEVGARTKLARRFPDGTVQPLKIGDTLELNDNRAIVVGIARVTRTFQSQPILYTTYSRATSYAPKERRLLSFVLVKASAGESPKLLAERIKKETGLGAFTREEFKEKTVGYFLKNTGIPINFGIAVILGLLVGTVIAGQTFYNFTLDNLRYFGALKAMGATSGTLLKMIVVQAVMVGCIGYGLGVGGASWFYFISKKSELAFFLPWQLLLIVGGAVVFICVLAAILSMIKVIKLDPAVVFRS